MAENENKNPTFEIFNFRGYESEKQKHENQQTPNQEKEVPSNNK